MHVMDPATRGGNARALRLVVVAASVALAVVGAGAGAGPARAAGGGTGDVEGTFADVFARSRLVAVAVVEAAPPADADLRLAVEASLKGDPGPRLVFAAGATTIALEKGSRVVLLAMDPAVLDFRGTVALTVGSDGTIDPGGFSGVPATVAALLDAYGPSAATPAPPDASTAAPTATAGEPAGSGTPWGVLLILAAIGIAAAVAVAADVRRRT